MKNILLITADQLRWDALGFAGRFPVRTPNIDALAERGVVFDNAYCANPLCVPARASIMNGRLAADSGVYYNDQGWDESMPTIAGELSGNGYYSVAVGKMHFRPGRRYYGFDKRRADNDTDYREYLQRRGIQKEKFGSLQDMFDHSFTTEPTGLSTEDFLPFYIARNAVDELDLIVSRRNATPEGNEPFFMWYSFVLPHTPCNPPEPYFSMYDPADFLPFNRSEAELSRFSKPMMRWKHAWDRIDDTWAGKLRAQYMGCVTLVDELIGRVIDKLKDLGLYDNTLVVVSSDHGDYMGDHHMMQKGFFHEPSARIPLIVSGPGAAAGTRVGAPVSQIDFMPTLMDYCKLLPTRSDDSTGTSVTLGGSTGDAVSLLPAISGDADALDADRVLIADSGIHGLAVMLRWRNLKIVWYDNTREMDWFDLADDPDEQHNLAEGKTQADIPGPMRAALTEYLHRCDRWRQTTYYFNGKVRPMFT